MRKRYLSHRQTAKTQASMHIRTVSPEPSLFAHTIIEPPHDKTNKMTVCPAKTQISLGIRPVWSESSLCAQWIAKDPSLLHADREDSCLPWVHMPFCWFCHEAAHIWKKRKVQTKSHISGPSEWLRTCEDPLIAQPLLCNSGKVTVFYPYKRSVYCSK